ncbi:TetR/AcrR family transcriptional regulator [Streptomyces sp. NBC_00390]|uniref:TetR/AcrR family transcriptional regulator n=1 Tax=Streptomyces sp. NBC_00390 TaxID=2975736 RepID=UPI002E237F05
MTASVKSSQGAGSPRPGVDEARSDRPRRREPVQTRSRETVKRILDAAAGLIDEGGVDAVTTRVIADHAGITAASLYRFFADREQILDALVERHLERLTAHVAAVEADWAPTSVAEFVERELDSYAGYYRDHPNAARLWLDGRVSPTVRAEVLRYHRSTAERLHGLAVAAGLVTPQTDLLVFVVAVELADRTLELAFRERSDPDSDVIAYGRVALIAYLDATLPQ